jgi:cobalamin synthase
MSELPVDVVPSSTTAEQDRKTAGQRHINLIWELTQAVIALSVTTITLYTASKLALFEPAQTASFLLLSNAFFLVIGFYFGRTNHQRSGGVGGDGAGTR